MITICLLILIYSILNQPVGDLVRKLKEVDWQRCFQTTKEWIQHYAKIAGRAAARPVLQWWLVMQDENTTTFEKAMIYGAIAYIIVPNDLIPRRVFRFFGVLDDVAVAAWLYNKIGDKLTQEMKDRVEDILDDWFGSEAVISVR